MSNCIKKSGQLVTAAAMTMTAAPARWSFIYQVASLTLLCASFDISGWLQLPQNFLMVK